MQNGLKDRFPAGRIFLAGRGVRQKLLQVLAAFFVMAAGGQELHQFVQFGTGGLTGAELLPEIDDSRVGGIHASGYKTAPRRKTTTRFKKIFFGAHPLKSGAVQVVQF
jgi:hypothetical protein